MSRLKELYNSEIKKAMTDKFGYKMLWQFLRWKKIVINMGVGEAKEKFKIIRCGYGRFRNHCRTKTAKTIAKNSALTLS